MSTATIRDDSSGSSMRIALVTSRFPYAPTESFLAPEIRGFQNRSHQVTIVPVHPAARLGDPSWADLTGDTLARPLMSLSILRATLRMAVCRPGRVLSALGWVLSGRGRLRNLLAFPKALWLADWAETERVDHIHAYWASVPATVAGVAASIAGLPWSFTAHRWDITEDNLLREKIAAAAFTRFIAESGVRAAEQVIGDVLPGPSTVIHLGVDLPSDPIAPRAGAGPVTVLCVAALRALKGHHDLLQAFARVAAENPGVRLELAGDGEQRPALEADVERLGLGPRVTFLGHVPHSALLRRYHGGEIDLVVLASGIEGVPVSLMEAMAHTVPVVATSVGGVSELVDDATGRLVPFGAPADLADAILELVVDPVRRRIMGQAARQTIESSFSALASTAALERCFASTATRQATVLRDRVA